MFHELRIDQYERDLWHLYVDGQVVAKSKTLNNLIQVKGEHTLQITSGAILQRQLCFEYFPCLKEIPIVNRQQRFFLSSSSITAFFLSQQKIYSMQFSK